MPLVIAYHPCMAGKLYSPPPVGTIRSLALRAGFIVGLIGTAVLVLWLERGQLIDHNTGEPPDLPSIIYFAMVTVTTVGYGDIVPITTFARMVDTFFLVPVRFIVLFTFLGTAYQVVLRRFQEEYRMKRMADKLKNHVIVCGFGPIGRVAVKELLLQGTPPDHIVAIDQQEEVFSQAPPGIITVVGDAREEAVLHSVAIARAHHVIVCPGRDDSAVLIALNIQDINPEIQIIAACRQDENAKLLRRAGVQIIISPAAAGGNLLAAATRRSHLVETMTDMLSVGGTMRVDERKVAPNEVGQHPTALKDKIILRVYRDGVAYNVGRFPVLEEGDTLVLVSATQAE